ncbi:hypothetical protein NFJ02_06g127230 [Pycnococcus provasolii]
MATAISPSKQARFDDAVTKAEAEIDKIKAALATRVDAFRQDVPPASAETEQDATLTRARDLADKNTTAAAVKTKARAFLVRAERPPSDGVARLVHDALAVRRDPDDGKARFCVWFRDLNGEMVVESFTMPTVGDCLARASADHWAFRRDLSKAFLQLTMDPDDVGDMGFVDPFTGEVLCFRAPMFGLAAAPRYQLTRSFALH